ncbi:hypothetical protein NUU61_002801 [Penicillium alfredii]|uniref:SAP domain-containing protein n=1 Tax=Penicillium alfredii TaxID=1506179 RepID=A0A9W9FSE6_9EURO|nr:uncharacterized protein NUU61_002801 [Penicillium alfredii]KAJ5105454.1 hypothetical protein NUU61_002801 [Penicillium alfredii]
MRLSAALYGPRAPWLPLLKSAQLQRLARATGVQSSGTKKILVDRIENELLLQPGSREQRQQPPSERGYGLLKTGHARPSEPWSILSIDMGIQNLAFAHLRVHPPSSRWNGGSGSGPPPTPELTAWHRLAVSEIASLNLNTDSGSTGIDDDAVPGAGSTLPQSTPITPTIDIHPNSPSTTTSSNKEKDSSSTKDSFSPKLYAANAYTLLTTLLSAYRPTHILIERQRFRSGGASTVLEWTLRVGVLEGMLYAVLHTLRQERGGELASVQVHGIEPRRVVRYWTESEAPADANTTESKKKKKNLTAREVKKAKIDLVGRWLAASLPVPGGEETTETDEKSAGSAFVAEPLKISLAEDKPVLHDLARAYLRKWQGQSQKRKGSRSLKTASAGDALLVDPGKLDDLADCLLQGVTWFEWQVMRERIAREGVEALDSSVA